MKAEVCERRFDESLLSGLIDGVLTQGDRQRVQLHLEECETCRLEVEQMTVLRKAALSTSFPTVPDDQWNEAPRSPVSRVLRFVGLGALALWFASIVGLLFASEETLQELRPWVIALGVSGAGSVFLSALLDRLAVLPQDIYRGVKK